MCGICAPQARLGTGEYGSSVNVRIGKLSCQLLYRPTCCWAVTATRTTVMYDTHHQPPAKVEVQARLREAGKQALFFPELRASKHDALITSACDPLFFDLFWCTFFSTSAVT